MTCISSCIYVTHTIYIYTYIHNNIYIKREREHMMLCYVMFQEIWHHDSSFSSLHRKNDEDRLQRRRIEAETRCAPWNGRGWSKISQEIPGGRGNKSGKPQFWKFFSHQIHWFSVRDRPPQRAPRFHGKSLEVVCPLVASTIPDLWGNIREFQILIP